MNIFPTTWDSAPQLRSESDVSACFSVQRGEILAPYPAFRGDECRYSSPIHNFFTPTAHLARSVKSVMREFPGIYPGIGHFGVFSQVST